MPRYMFTFNYSAGSLARMLKVADDRRAALSGLMEHLDGKLELVYWGVQTTYAYVIAELPDSVMAAAVAAACTKTGAFRDVEVDEVLTQEQVHDVIALAKASEGFYSPPGAAAIEQDIREAG